MKRLIGLLFALLTIPAWAQVPSTLPPNTVVGRLGAGTPGPPQAIPFAQFFAGFGFTPQTTTPGDVVTWKNSNGSGLSDSGINIAPPAPHYARVSAQNAPTSIAIDSNTTLIKWWAIGGGGGGSGNTTSNRIPYALYGGAGTVSALLLKPVQFVTISNASPGIVTQNNHGYICNQPIYFEADAGVLPAQITAGVIYYVGCDVNLTTNTYDVSTTLYNDVIFTSTPINTSGGSGTVDVFSFYYNAIPGFGGGAIGDQALPGGYIGCDANGPAGYVQSFGFQGGAGKNIYGWNTGSGNGGEGMLGGAGVGGIGFGGGSPGTNLTGAGGAGAGATGTSSGGGGGGAAGFCWGEFRPNGAATLEFIAGTGGIAGTAGADAVTISHASPAVFTLTGHQFAANAVFTLTNIVGAGGFSTSTNYFVCNDASLTTNTFTVSTAGNCATPVNSTSSGTATLNSGGPGAAGGNGALMIIQYKGIE